MSRLPGKKIDQWEWSKERQTFKVDVRLAPDSRNGGMHFGVVVPELDINLWHKDINELRRLVFAELDNKVNIKWERFLHIKVIGDTSLLKIAPEPEDEDEEIDDDALEKMSAQEVRERTPKVRSIQLSLEVKVESYELATSPSGQKLSRRVEEHHSVRQAQEEWPETGHPEQDGNWRNRWGVETQDEVAALVPDTPANREALNQLARELQKLIDRLVAICEPEVIQHTLSSAIGTHLLSQGHPQATE